MGGGGIITELQQQSTQTDEIVIGPTKVQQGTMVRTVKIGVRNLTENAGATSLIYMLKKELDSAKAEIDSAKKVYNESLKELNDAKDEIKEIKKQLKEFKTKKSKDDE